MSGAWTVFPLVPVIVIICLIHIANGSHLVDGHTSDVHDIHHNGLQEDDDVPGEDNLLKASKFSKMSKSEKKFAILNALLDKKFIKLEDFWRLGWKGYQNFNPSGSAAHGDDQFPHLRGTHVNHHTWEREQPLAYYGLPIDGILERSTHPWHKQLTRDWGLTSVTPTHLMTMNEHGPIDAQHHYFTHFPYGEELDPDYARFAHNYGDYGDRDYLRDYNRDYEEPLFGASNQLPPPDGLEQLAFSDRFRRRRKKKK